MSLHLELSGLHLRRPSAHEVRAVGRYVAVGAVVPVIVLAANAGVMWPVLVTLAAVAGAKVGHLRGTHVQRLRHIKAEEGHLEVIHQQRVQIAGFQDEQRFWWNAGKPDRHLNSSYGARTDASTERSSR